MRKNLILIFLIAAFAVCLSAEAEYRYDAPFGWQSPEIMAQGGSFTAVASGFNSLMSNPAGFAMSKNYKYTEVIDDQGERVVEKKEKGEVTVLGLLPWATINPFTFADDLKAVDPSTDSIDFSNDLTADSITEAVLNQSSTNGIGAGLQLGFGYVGHGLGLGFVTTLDMRFPQTDNILGINGDVTVTSSLIGGYAFQFDLGDFGLSIGADIRPMWRIKIKDINVNTVLGLMGGGGSDGVDLSTIDALTGFAIGFDLGAIAEWNMLSLGLSVRDIGHTRYQYQLTSLTELQNDLFNGSEYSGLEYITPMTMRIGLGIHPDLGKLSRFIDPKAHVEYVIPLIDAESIVGFEEQSFWVNLHAGAEVKLLSFLSVRAGYSSGYLSAGLGIDLFIAELNAAIYSQETGSHAGSNQQMGGSVELAFRF